MRTGSNAHAGARIPRPGQLGLVVVTVDTSPRAVRYPGDDDAWDFGQGAGFYVDATAARWSGTYRMFSWVSAELPAVVEAMFPVADRRGIFGHSMGGRPPHHGRMCGILGQVADSCNCTTGNTAHPETS